MCIGCVRCCIPNDESKPTKPKQWSPCKWEIKMLYNLEVCTPRRCIVICTPSPQSTRNDLSHSSTICPEGEFCIVGRALPLPNMVTLQGIIYLKLGVLTYLFSKQILCHPVSPFISIKTPSEFLCGEHIVEKIMDKLVDDYMFIVRGEFPNSFLSCCQVLSCVRYVPAQSLQTSYSQNFREPTRNQPLAVNDRHPRQSPSDC